MLEKIKADLEAAIPGCLLEIIPNGSPSAQHSLLIDSAHAVKVTTFLRDNAELRFDYCSNVTGVDRLQTEQSRGYLEAVYHLYSMEKKHGPVILRLRTENRSDKVHLPSLTPVWRSAEFQEREIFDLYGIIFDGHPDLRRILMWDEFEDHPMRKDYVEPDDYEYEPTAHDEVLAKANRHSVGNSE
jgi:NADH-quinone oxidoreductase subunit C